LREKAEKLILLERRRAYGGSLFPVCQILKAMAHGGKQLEMGKRGGLNIKGKGKV
jgi:hypothetical protein